jgi:HAD superfamily hydrolase (TIGR01509 family)
VLLAPPRAVLFDYGNTLVEYTARQVAVVDRALGDLLERRFGRVDRAALAELHARQRMAPYRAPFLENEPGEMVAQLVAELHGRAPDAELLGELLAARRRAFDASIVRPGHVLAVLEKLSGRFRLALVSNYPCASSIRESLERIELARFFETIVVSAEVGRVKPHPAPFEAALSRLELAAGECLFVGDNWLGDVQGAKRLGMRAVHLVQYDTHERFEPAPGDHPADATLGHLEELPALLGLGP